jgi:hypothetical protein
MEKCFHGFHDTTPKVQYYYFGGNQFSKLAKIVSIITIASTFDMTKMFFDMWARHHGMP